MAGESRCACTADRTRGAEDCKEKNGDLDIEVICRKCRKDKASVKERGPGGYCRKCFLKAATKRFMSAMSRNTLMEPRSSILISLSGGWGSRMCLHLCLDYLVNSKHRAPGRIGVVFVKEFSDEEDDEIAETLAADVASLNGVDDNGLQIINIAHHISGSYEEAISILESAKRKDHSAVDEARRILRERAVVECARRGNYSRIVDGSCGTTLTARSISGLASGIGFAIPSISTYYDARFSPTDHQVAIVRPLHDCTAKEVALYCYFSHLVAKFRRPSSRGQHLTLDSVSRHFVHDISESMPSSNHNILASFGKLTLFPFNHSLSADDNRPSHADNIPPQFNIDSDSLEHLLCEFCCLPRDERDLQSNSQQRLCRRCADCISK